MGDVMTEPWAVAVGEMSWSVAGSELTAYTVQKAAHLLDPHNSTLALSIPATRDALNRAIVIIDAGFDAHWGLDVRMYVEKWSVSAEFVVIDVDDGRTTTEVALALAARIGELRVDRRRAPLIAIGGGFLLDVVDLVASIFRRGIPFVRVPTTMLAQVDAGIGAYSGVDTGIQTGGANPEHGTHRAPTHVFVDTAFLTTLSRRHLANGLAEVLSVAILLDAQLFELLEANAQALLDSRFHIAPGDEVVTRAIGVIIAEQGPNPTNRHIEDLAEVHHIFGPAIEMAFPGAMLHGESVAMDIVVSCWIAHRRGLLDITDLHRVIATAHRLELPTWDPRIDPDLLVSALREADARRAGAEHLPLPARVGKATFADDVTSGEVLAACAAAKAC